MIHATSCSSPFSVDATNGGSHVLCDTLVENGGGGKGFSPHQLLEVALAACMNITVRKKALEIGLQLDSVSVTVSLDRTGARPVFRYRWHTTQRISGADWQMLNQAVEECPVCRTISLGPATMSFPTLSPPLGFEGPLEVVDNF